MKIPPAPHRWSVTPRQAIAIQKRLASLVEQGKPRANLRLIAGIDAAFSPDGRWCIAAVVLWDLCSRTVVEQHVGRRRLTFPYIPGLLSFRETPAVVAALRKLHQPPDAVICDGHGLAHPRRFGLACHVGVLVDVPTIGCAKSRLLGRYREPDTTRGSKSSLTDNGETLNTVLRTQDTVKPVFVSVGHKIDLSTAERIVLICATRYRLPEPTRLADRLVAMAKRATRR